MSEITKEAVRKFMLNKYFGSGEANGIMEKVNNNPYIPMDVKKKLFATARAKPYGEYVKTSPLNLDSEIAKLNPVEKKMFNDMDALGSIAQTFKDKWLNWGRLVKPQSPQQRVNDFVQLNKNGPYALRMKLQDEFLPYIAEGKQDAIRKAILRGDNKNSALSSWYDINERATKAFAPYHSAAVDKKIPEGSVNDLFQHTADIIRKGV